MATDPRQDVEQIEQQIEVLTAARNVLNDRMEADYLGQAGVRSTANYRKRDQYNHQIEQLQRSLREATRS